MEPVVAPLAGVLELNTDLLLNCLEGVSDESAQLLAGLDAITSGELATPGAHRFPVLDTSRLGLGPFLTQHDSYHIGQLAFLRRQLGRSPMAYTRGTATASR